MCKKIIFVAFSIALIICLASLKVEASHRVRADKTILAYAQMYAFGSIENMSATGLTQDRIKELEKQSVDNLMRMFQNYPLNSENEKIIRTALLSKLRDGVKITTRIKKEDREHPVVELTAVTIDENKAIASMSEEFLTLDVMKQLAVDARDESSLTEDAGFQLTAIRTLNKFIDKISFGAPKTTDIVCSTVKGKDNELYWAPDDPSVLKNFLVPDFVIEGASSETVRRAIAGIFVPGNQKINEPADKSDKPQKPIEPRDKNDKWLIYWYISGTNLETGNPLTNDLGGAASRDIKEMLDVKLSSNVRVLLFAGGAPKWENRKIKGNGLYSYTAENGFKKEKDFNENMGLPDTLKDFLQYGENEYNADFNADHKMLIFWDHGGLGGVCEEQYLYFLDENGEKIYDRELDESGQETAVLAKKNILSLNDINSVLTSIYGDAPSNTPFDIIGFDACLMGTYDNANNLEGFANFMIASEDSEANLGWYYTDWLSRLVRDPSIDGEALGEIICNSSYDAYKKHMNQSMRNNASIFTMSVTDISEVSKKVRPAHEKFWGEALRLVNDIGDDFVTGYFDKRVQLKEYGNNLLDLKSIAQSVLEYTGSDDYVTLKAPAQELVSAIDDAVKCNVVGESHKDNSDVVISNGLSTYYPNRRSGYMFSEYFSQNATYEGQKKYYERVLKVDLTSDVENDNNINAPKGIKGHSDNMRIASLQNFPASVKDDTNHAFIKLTPEQMKFVSTIRCLLATPIESNMDPDIRVDSDGLLILGTDYNIQGSWSTGEFRDNFRGVWARLDGNLVSLFITDQPNFNNSNVTFDDQKDSGRNSYIIPIKVNGVKRNLQAVYDFADKKYYLIGMREDSNSGVVSRRLIPLKEGDIVTPLFYATDSKASDEVIEIEGRTFKISKNPALKDEKLYNGQYIYLFEFQDMGGNTACSSPVIFRVGDEGSVEDVIATEYIRGRFVIKENDAEELAE